MADDRVKPRHILALHHLPSCPPSEGIRPAEIAYFARKTVGAMQRVMFDLREWGYAAVDERTRKHAITPAGREILEEAFRDQH